MQQVFPLRFWFSLGLIHQVWCSVIHACDGSIATAAKAEGNAGHRATQKTIQLQLTDRENQLKYSLDETNLHSRST